MTIYATGNALGSTDVRDLLDNAQNLDDLMLGQLRQYLDRLGVPRLSWAGIEAAFQEAQVQRSVDFDEAQTNRENVFNQFLTNTQFESTPIPYVEGSPLEVLRPTQLISHEGQLYSVKLPATFPVVLSGVWDVAVASLTPREDASVRQQLAAPTGAGMVGTTMGRPWELEDATVAKKLSQLTVDIYDFSDKATNKGNASNPDTWNWTEAFEAARQYLTAQGGGVLTLGPYGIYQADYITLDRSILIKGLGVWVHELRQTPGVNRDFIKSENFDALTGSGLTVNDPRVPSWFGLMDLRVNGNRFNAASNPGGNTSGTGVKFYGPSQLLWGTVMIFGCANIGIYTEDAANASGSSWRAQEEGRFHDVVVMDNGGFAGWHCRGPHNNAARSITCGRNDGWGFYSEETDTYGGSFDSVGLLHTYANGRGVNPAADTGAYIGGIARIDTLVTDGDNLTVAANNVQISKWRAFNLGGTTNSVISGQNCQISNFNGAVWAQAENSTGLIITGANCTLNGTLDLNAIGSPRPNNGVSISGTGHTIDLTIRNFSAAGSTAMTVATTDSEINCKIRNCETGFNYVSGSDNQVRLSIGTSAGQVPVTGQSPRASDRISIVTRGAVVKSTKASIQSAVVPMDTVLVQSLTIAHGLLYAPDRLKVVPTWMVSSPDTTTHTVAYLEVVSADATNVVIRYKLATAGPAGSVARISINIDMA